MKSIFFVLAFVASVAYAQPTAPLESRAERAADILSKTPTNSFLSGPDGAATANTMIALQDKIIENDGCNLNLCFGLDGSNLITDKDYEFQREFVQLVAATISIDERVKMSAYQYGLRLQRISGFTGNINQFLINMENVERQSTLDRSFLTPALFQCQRDFRDSSADANKIVLIGDGRTNYGSRSQAVRVAEQFLPPNNNGAICAVYVQKPVFRFLEKMTQSRDRVLDVEDYFFFADILDKVEYSSWSAFMLNTQTKKSTLMTLTDAQKRLVTAVREHKANPQLSIRSLSRKYTVPRTTLQRACMTDGSDAVIIQLSDGRGRKQHLSPDEEDLIVQAALRLFLRETPGESSSHYSN